MSPSVRFVAASAIIVLSTQGFAADGPGARTPPSDATGRDGTRPGQTARGKASFYAPQLKGRKTASGERYDPNALTAAHRTLPLGTKVRVSNPNNDKSVVVTVNDRGPVPKGRMLDVSGAAADALDMKRSGVTRVETEVVGAPAVKRP